MQKSGTIRVFKSEFLERFTHVHPLTPAIFWIPVVSWLFWRCFAIHRMSVALVFGLALLGFITWTLSEYLLHRFVFHLSTGTPLRARLQFLIHGLHHDAPQDATRLVMPPLPAVVLASALYALFKLALGSPRVEPFFAAFLTGYLCYDYIHYYVHHFNPRSRTMKMIKQHHMLHHYAEHGAKWGVSSPFWDYVFGTVEDRERPRPSRPSTA
jgi:sterol desaturase/sphingolipid hydroxylase (fatty acid hydroxylase superfamily)